MAVWGDVFTRLMADVTVPTNLSPGNLPALAQDADVTFHVYCSHASEVMLRAAPALPALERVARVEFHSIGSERIANAKNHYDVLSHCHRRAIRVARDRGEALVVLSPDAIWSDGSFARMHEITRRGARAIMMAAPRACKSDFLRDFPAARDYADDGSLTLDHRALMGRLLDHLHPCTEDLIWREDRLSSWPSQLLWQVGRRDLLVRAFHLHPLMIRPSSWDAHMPETIDGRFVAAAIDDPGKIHIVRDSDEIAACELTDTLASQVHVATPNLDSGTRRVAAWMHRATDALHRRYVEQPIRLHAGAIGKKEEAAYCRVEAESLRVLARIQRGYRRLEPARERGSQHVSTHA